MIINFKEYKEIYEQKKAVIWDFLTMLYLEHHDFNIEMAYEDMTKNIKEINKHYSMIIDYYKKRKIW